MEPIIIKGVDVNGDEKDMTLTPYAQVILNNALAANEFMVTVLRTPTSSDGNRFTMKGIKGTLKNKEIFSMIDSGLLKISSRLNTDPKSHTYYAVPEWVIRAYKLKINHNMGQKIGHSRFIAYLYAQESVRDVISRNFPGAVHPDDSESDNSFILKEELYCYDRINIEDLQLDGCYIIEVYRWEE